MRRERVAKAVRRYLLRHAAGADVLIYDAPDAAVGQALAVIVQKDGVLILYPGPGARIEILPDRVQRGLAYRHDPLFRAFAHHLDDAAYDIDVVDVEPDQLADAYTGRIQRLEESPVAETRGIALRRRLQELFDLGDIQEYRQLPVELRGRDRGYRVLLDISFAEKEPEKAPQGRQLPGDRPLRVVPGAQLREEPPKRQVVDRLYLPVAEESLEDAQVDRVIDDRVVGGVPFDLR